MPCRRPARSSTSSRTGTSRSSRPEHIIYFRDVYDHLIRVTDELDNDRELVAGTLDVYLSTINNNLSTIMKRLTGVTVDPRRDRRHGRHLRHERGGRRARRAARRRASGS